MRAVSLLVAALLAMALLPAAAFAAPYVISDFESDADLAQWSPTGAIVDCPAGSCVDYPATLSRVAEQATNGNYSCRMDLPPVDFPGMSLSSFPTHDWSAYDVYRMDLYNPNPLAVTLELETSDSQSGYGKRHYFGRTLIPGLNHVEMDLHTMIRNDGSGNVNPADMQRLTFWISGFSTDISVYVDYIRLDTVQDDPGADALRNIWKFDFGTATSPRWRDLFRVTDSSSYPVNASTQPFGWTGGYCASYDYGGPDDIGRDFVRGLCCPTDTPFDFRLDLPNGDYTVYLVARAGDNRAMPTLDFSVSAEGVQRVHVPMDSATFYADDYYYRGKSDDYPLSQSYWDRYVAPNYPVHTFTVTVTDGHLDLSFVRAYIYAMIVYPTSLAGEMTGRIAGWEADRQTQFESAYYINGPQSLTFTPTPEETARGYAAWPTAVLFASHPDTLPPDPRPALALEAEACQDERRPVSLAIRPLADLADLSVAVTDLADGSGHSIPAGEIESRYVRYLATPDTEFFGAGLLSWKPRLLQSDFPLAVKAQVTKQLWLTVHVPNGTPAGTYTGTVTVHASSGDLAMPLAVTVWPFALDLPDDMSYGWYYMSPDERYCFSWFPDLAGAGDTMLRADFADMKRHGFNAVQYPTPGCGSIDPGTGQIGSLDMGELDRFVSAMSDTGFGAPGQSQVGTLSIGNAILGSSSVSEFDANFDAAFGDALARIVSWGETDGTPLVMYLVDEPRESMIQPWNRNFADTMQYCDLANQVPGVVSTVTVMQDNQEGVDYTPLASALDIMQTHPWSPSGGLVDTARAEGKPVWFYNTGGDLRLVYGFYQYKKGNGCWEWHYDWLDGDLWDPFPYSPFNNHWRYTYPSADGPVATLNYEWGSQGIWDYRYAATLDRLSRSARATGLPEFIAWADQADALLSALRAATPEYPSGAGTFAGIGSGPSYLSDLQGALDDYRRQIAQMIMALPGPLPGDECEVVTSSLPAALEWETSAAVSITYRNLGTATWTPAEGYQLLPTGQTDRWGLTSLPLTQEVAPAGTCSFDFEVVAPPLTTLVHRTPVTPTAAPVTDGIGCDWSLSRVTSPLAGGTVPQETVISRFPDIGPGTSGEWARAYTEECAGRVPLLVQGFGDGTYRPTAQVARDAMAVYIGRALKLSLGPYQARFPDVPSDQWARPYIEALAAADIVKGFGDGTYRPSNIVHRDAMAAFVARGMAGGDGAVPPGPPTATFPDVPTTHPFFRYVEYAVSRGVVEGFGDGTYRPAEPVTRAHMSAYVYRAFIGPSGVPVVLGGPAVTRVDPGAVSYFGWSSIGAGPAAGPGYAYVVFDAARLATNLCYPAPDGTWQAKFELRSAAAPEVPAQGDYTTTVSLTTDDITAARDAAVASGSPYSALHWAIPSTLAPGDYLLVVSASDAGGVLREAPRRASFTITP